MVTGMVAMGGGTGAGGEGPVMADDEAPRVVGGGVEGWSRVVDG